MVTRTKPKAAAKRNPAPNGVTPASAHRPEVADVNLKLEVRMDEGRMMELVPMSEWFTIGEIMATANQSMLRFEWFEPLASFAAKFVWDQGDYVDPQRAFSLISRVNLSQLITLVTTLYGAAEEDAVPNDNGQASASP